MRLQTVAKFKSKPKLREEYEKVWKEFLEKSPSRRILCLGVSTTCPKFSLWTGMEIIRSEEVKTSHGNVKAKLLVGRFNEKDYQVVAGPHLSRFHVGADKALTKAIQRHFK